MIMRPTRWLLVFLVTISPMPAWGQAVPSREPSSTHIFPAGGKRGSIVKVRVGGECLPPGMNLQLFGKGLTGPGKLGPEAKARYEPSLRRTPRDADAVGASMTYPREFNASLTIATDADTGAHFWRVWGGWGGTRLRPFIVGDLPEFIETEPNSQPERAERITLPIVVNGQIAGERDQDYFVFSATAGKLIVLDVMSARIGSPLEPVVAVFNPAGKRIEINETRVGGDPVASFQVPETGDYRLHIANLGYFGGPAYVYRINIKSDPSVPFTFPSQAKQTEIPGIVESGDNRSPKSAMELKLPVVVNARFLKADEEDWFQWVAKKGEKFTIAGHPFPYESAAVPLLSLFDASGACLAKAGNIENPDRGFEIDWQAPADGIYRMRLRDLQHGSRGGPEFAYRLAIRSARPGFALRFDTDYVNVVQSSKTEIDLHVDRSGGFTGQIELAATGLPEGVKIEPAVVPVNQTHITLNVIAAADTRPSNHAVRILGNAQIDGQRIKSQAIVHAFGWRHDDLQLTVQHKPIFKLSCNEAYQYAHRGSIHPYLMKIERLDGFSGPITMQLCDRQVQDLDGIEIIETIIPPDAKEAQNLIYLPESMHASVQHHSRPYAQAYATFTDKWGQEQTLLAVSTHRCMIRTLPPVLKLRPVTQRISAWLGDVVECKLSIDRSSIFTGPVDVTIKELRGVKADDMRIEGKQSEATLRIHLTGDLQLLEDDVITIRATGRLASNATVISEVMVPIRLSAKQESDASK